MSAFAPAREGSGSGRSMVLRARVAPSAAILWGIALAGVAAAICVVVLRVTSDHGGAEPGLQAALLDWIVCSYVLSGLIAWWRRPESRFGPLMVVAGFVTALSSLSSASAALPFTIGEAADLIPVAIFLHVFLAFPTGRLDGRLERALVGAAYAVAVGLQLLGLMLGGFSRRTCWRSPPSRTSRPRWSRSSWSRSRRSRSPASWCSPCAAGPGPAHCGAPPPCWSIRSRSRW